MSLLFPLRSHVMRDAKVLALKLTLLSDIAFAAVTERTMAIGPDIMDTLLRELCRFLIEAAETAREMAPTRSLETAAYELACANAATDTLRQTIFLRDREMARAPLRQIAARLGIPLDESDPDWQRLAYRALRVMLEAHEEDLRRDQGQFESRSEALLQALNPARHLGHAPARYLSMPTALQVIPPVSATAGRGHLPASAPAAPIPQTAEEASIAPVMPDLAHSDFLPAVPTRPAPQAPAPTRQSPTNVAATTPCPTISEGSEDYIARRCQGYASFKPTEQPSPASGESWEKNSSGNVKSTARLMARILGDRPFDQILSEELTAAFTLMQRIPRNYQAATSRLSPREAADRADETETRSEALTRDRLKKEGASPGKIELTVLREKLPRLKAATIYRHMQDFQRICVFQKGLGHLRDNIMEGHIWEKREYDRRVLEEADTERQTWCGRLDGLFRTPLFQDKLDDAGDPMFWAPLISVHSGLRSEEVLQLATNDVQVIDEIPCFVLRQGLGQNLKSAAARRTVPVHKNLLALGFMHLLALRKREGEPRLFPWLTRSEAKKTYTENFSKRFTYYRKTHKVYDAQRDFHSFRTTFNHRLIEAGCPDTQRRSLLGHVERDVGITNYNPSGFSKALLLGQVNAIEIDVSMIRPPFGDIEVAGVTHLADRRRLAAS
ncbi:tyrosine-type recombinase/integrase [Salipiger sp. H15]|uniref:Tyrosine-type recombinase/integrase n=1 Tax=Alloyangia sp. H15 TaxID=3029062 RepID=A0AAU8AFD6_9RHOB